MKYVEFWCEYDLGINGTKFTTVDIAKSHVRQALLDVGLLPEDGYTVEGMMASGLLSFKELEVHVISQPIITVDTTLKVMENQYS